MIAATASKGVTMCLRRPDQVATGLQASARGHLPLSLGPREQGGLPAGWPHIQRSSGRSEGGGLAREGSSRRIIDSAGGKYSRSVQTDHARKRNAVIACNAAPMIKMMEKLLCTTSHILNRNCNANW